MNDLTNCDRVAKFTVLLSEPDLLVARKATLFDNFSISFRISSTTQKFGIFLYKKVNRISEIGLYKFWLCAASSYFDEVIHVPKYLLLFFLSSNAAGANLRFPLNIWINLFLTLTATIQSRQEELNDSNAQVGVTFVQISSVKKYTLGYAIIKYV